MHILLRTLGNVNTRLVVSWKSFSNEEEREKWRDGCRLDHQWILKESVELWSGWEEEVWLGKRVMEANARKVIGKQLVVIDLWSCKSVIFELVKNLNPEKQASKQNIPPSPSLFHVLEILSSYLGGLRWFVTCLRFITCLLPSD